MAVRDGLARLCVGKTLIIVAHRLNTIRDADAIVVLKDSGVAEIGTHRQLLGLNGPYAAFWDRRRRAEGWRISDGGPTKTVAT